MPMVIVQCKYSASYHRSLVEMAMMNTQWQSNAGAPRRPVGVTTVAVLMLMAAAFAFARLMSVITNPMVQHDIQQTFHSVRMFVFFSLVGAGMAVACGIGLLMGRDWARLLYLLGVPMLLLLSILLNGLQAMHLSAAIFYGIFAFVLTRRESVEFFAGSTRR